MKSIRNKRTSSNKHKEVKKIKTSNREDENDDMISNEPAIEYLQFATGKKLFGSFIGDEIGLDRFLSEYWEKKPLLIKRNDNAEWLKYVQTLFSYDKLKSLIESKKSLKYGKDVNLCRLVDGKKENYNKKGPVKLEHVTEMFENKKATIQFHQPQRFSNQLWKLLEKLESYFNNLVGSNIYITPDDSQGLPPHHDDIEAFVVQLEGAKHWQIFEPTDLLSNEYKLADASLLKQPILEITLQPGDILYFPRGYIHQAKKIQDSTTSDKSFSTHITISTFQNNNTMEFILSVMHKLNQSYGSNSSLRKGLPFDFFKKSNFNEILKEELLKIDFKANSCYPTELLKDFMNSRLPPYSSKLSEEYSISELESIQTLDKDLKVKLRYPEHVNISIEAVNDDKDEDDEDDENHEYKSNVGKYEVLVFNSLSNKRENHMIMNKVNQENMDNCVKLSIDSYDVMKMLIDDAEIENKWFDLSDLRSKLNGSGDDVLKQLLVSLRLQNIIETKLN